ncbi:MAG: protein-glutamate O-methyltransferase [Deltaproteobacteria bacterium]|nr:protein-glutamate O-methyltransferase [Candidatus Anaeroferrophillacea bacterium]
MFTATTKPVGVDRLPSMSEADFRRFSQFIHQQCGINLTPAKKTMLTGRLQKRMRRLNITSYRDYYDYACRTAGNNNELVHMIDAVSTNKTDFFREPRHFDLLTTRALPELGKGHRFDAGRPLHVWSAGCSSGQEPYTTAMVLANYFADGSRGEFRILATDICTEVLDTAGLAIYPESAITPVPAALKRRYLLRGTGSRRGSCRVVPELRRRITFRRLNLIAGDSFGIQHPIHIIFCRNVIIYFDQPTQQRLFARFHDQLVPGGFLFIGHSETLHGINDRFVPVAAAVYRKLPA